MAGAGCRRRVRRATFQGESFMGCRYGGKLIGQYTRSQCILRQDNTMKLVCTKWNRFSFSLALSLSEVVSVRARTTFYLDNCLCR